MSTDAETGSRSQLPTEPCSVVWSMGHAFVLESTRWVGVDDRGRPQSLTNEDLERRGWSRTRKAS
jgi:hypothetical protein